MSASQPYMGQTIRSVRGFFTAVFWQYAAANTTIAHTLNNRPSGGRKRGRHTTPPPTSSPFIQELAEKDVRRRIAAIEDEIHLGREKAYADAVYYAHMKEADSNDRLLTDNFLEYSRILR